MIKGYRNRHLFATAAISNAVMLPFMKGCAGEALVKLLPSDYGNAYWKILDSITDEGACENPQHQPSMILDYWGSLRSYYTVVDTKDDFLTLIDFSWCLVRELNRITQETPQVPEDIKDIADKVSQFDTLLESSINELATKFVQDRVAKMIHNSAVESAEAENDELIAVSIRKSQVGKFGDFIRDAIVSGEFFSKNYADAKFSLSDTGQIELVENEEKIELDSNDVWVEEFDA